MTTLAAVLLSLIVLVPIPAECQNDTVSKNEIAKALSLEEIREEASPRLTQILEAVNAVDRYKALLEDASIEDSLVLKLQLFNSQLKGLQLLHELAEFLIELEQTEAQIELRGAVEEAYMLVTPRLWNHIDRLRGEIDAARALRMTVGVDKRMDLEAEIAATTDQLNQLYTNAQSHIEMSDQIGLDVLEAREFFTTSLAERADELSGRMNLALERISNLEARPPGGTGDADIAILIAAAKSSLSTNTKSMGIILNIMDDYDLSTGIYRTQLVSITRDLSTGLMEKEVAVNLLKQAVDKVTNWLSEDGLGFAVKLLLILGILLVFRLASRIVRRGVEKSLETSRLKLSRLLRRMIVTSVSNLVMLIGFLVALSQLGISLGPLMAGLGIIGFILGFALQDSLSNFASGMMILIYQPFDVGDLVDVGGVSGIVNRMSLVSTTILTYDNQSLVIPNNKIWGDVIKNFTAQKTRRVDMVFGISYSDDIPKAERVLMEILKSHELVLQSPAPEVHLHELGDSSVNFVVRPWAKTNDYWTVYWDVTRAVKVRFDEEQISIPFPQRDVHVIAGSSGNEPASPPE
jgi:small conductance mechanosensitive channel